MTIIDRPITVEVDDSEPMTAEVAIVIDTHPHVLESVKVQIAHRRSAPVPAESRPEFDLPPMRFVWPAWAKILLSHALCWGALSLGVAIVVLAWQAGR